MSALYCCLNLFQHWEDLCSRRAWLACPESIDQLSLDYFRQSYDCRSHYLYSHTCQHCSGFMYFEVLVSSHAVSTFVAACGLGNTHAFPEGPKPPRIYRMLCMGTIAERLPPVVASANTHRIIQCQHRCIRTRHQDR